MLLFKSGFRSHFAALLPAWLDAQGAHPSALQQREHIRAEMLAAAQALPHPPARLVCQIQQAHTVDDLWNLRGELMTALACICGEAIATQKLQSITQLFQASRSAN